jgi:RNA polymerase sigma-70 factor (ECF subfamily)
LQNLDALNKNTIVSDFEKELFSGIAAGNETDFTTLFNLFLPKLHPFILRFTRSELATQEIIQETFIRVWLSRDKLADIENPGGWLYKVASNECYNYVRKDVLNSKFSNVITGDNQTVNTTHEKLDARDINHLVTEAVYKMPSQRRKIYLMSRDEGKTIPQIAAALQISPNTVKNSLVTSLRFIREHLVKHGVVFYLFILLFGKK